MPHEDDVRLIVVWVLAFTALSDAVFSNEESPGTLSYYYEVARQTCHDISSIRIEMDRVNEEILELLAERTAYVKRAGDLKSQTTKVADDRQRVADQERKIVEKSRELELPTEISVPAFRVIMETSIRFQQQCIDQLP